MKGICFRVNKAFKQKISRWQKKKGLTFIFMHVKGWTFMETLIVMSIVMVLSASVGFSSVQQIDKARIVTAKSQIETFSIALNSYYLDMGEFPDSSMGLLALWQSPPLKKGQKWNGPYLAKNVPKDPWGNDYVYKRNMRGKVPYEILSYGKDGIPGGEGLNADIVSDN